MIISFSLSFFSFLLSLSVDSATETKEVLEVRWYVLVIYYSHTHRRRREPIGLRGKRADNTEARMEGREVMTDKIYQRDYQQLPRILYLFLGGTIGTITTTND